MSEVTFYFAVPINNIDNYAESPTGTALNNQNPMPSTNQALSCPSTGFAYFGDPYTSCSHSYTIRGYSGCCVAGCCVGCNTTRYCCPGGSNTGTGCAGWGYHAGQGNTPNKSDSNSFNYRCWYPKTGVLYLTTPNPISNPEFVSFIPTSAGSSSSNPTHIVFKVKYTISSFNTNALVKSAQDKFITNNSIQSVDASYNTTYYNTNVSSFVSLLNNLCASCSTSDLTTAPCNQYCGYTSGNISTNSSLAANTISNSKSNCVPAWTTYCNSNSTFATTPCTDFYSNRIQNGNGDYMTNIIKPNCNNSSYWTNPTPSNPLYVLNSTMPSICNCFLPQSIYNAYYDKLTALAPAVAGMPMTPQCTFKECSANPSSTAYILQSSTVTSGGTPPSFSVNNCPSVNITSCINQLNLNNSSVNNVNMSNECRSTLQIPAPPAPSPVTTAPGVAAPAASAAPAAPISMTYNAGAPPAAPSITYNTGAPPDTPSIPTAIPSTKKVTTTTPPPTKTTTNNKNLYFLFFLLLIPIGIGIYFLTKGSPNTNS